MNEPINWDAYYAKEAEIVDYREDPLAKDRCRAVWSVFPREKIHSLVDVGCGDGYFSHWIAGRISVDRVVGVDISKPRVERARSRYPEIEYLCASIGDLPFRNGEFEVVTCIESLEHQEDPDAALREIARVASRYVVLTVPDRGVIHTLLCPHCLRTFPASGHLHSFDPERLAGMAGAANLNLEKFRTYDPAYTSSNILLRLVRKGLKILKRPPRAMYLAARMTKR